MNDPDGFFALPPFKPAEALVALRRQVRDIKAVTERPRGDVVAYETKGRPVLELCAEADAIAVRLAKRALLTPEWEARRLTNAAEVRRFVDDLKQRAAGWTDEEG